MKKIIFGICLSLITLGGFSQVKTIYKGTNRPSTAQADTDDQAWDKVNSNDTYLESITGANNNDTLTAHNTRINNNVDSLAVHLDTLQSHNDRIISNNDHTNLSNIGTLTHANIDQMLQDSMKQFNIISYGATRNLGGDDDADNINAAIEAANAATYGGRVIFPRGIYHIEDSIVLKSNVFLDIDPFTHIYAKSGCNTIFYGGGEILQNCRVSGGQLFGADGDFNGFKFEFKASDEYGLNNRIENVTISDCDTAINIITDNSGWFNGNMFSNNWINDCSYQIYLGATSSSAGVSGNTFSNNQLQAGNDVLEAIHIDGNYNVFSPIMLWDYGLGGAQQANQKTIVFGSAASGNTIVTGQLSSDLTNAYDIDWNWHPNSIIMEGMPLDQEKIFHTQLTYASEAVDTLIFIQGNIRISGVEVAVSVLFNDSGTDYVDVGFTSSPAYLSNNIDVSAAGYQVDLASTMTHPQTGGYYIIAAYDGQNGDANQGIVDVFVYVTLLGEPVGSTE